LQNHYFTEFCFFSQSQRSQGTQSKCIVPNLALLNNPVFYSSFFSLPFETGTK